MNEKFYFDTFRGRISQLAYVTERMQLEAKLMYLHFTKSHKSLKKHKNLYIIELYQLT